MKHLSLSSGSYKFRNVRAAFRCIVNSRHSPEHTSSCCQKGAFKVAGRDIHPAVQAVTYRVDELGLARGTCHGAPPEATLLPSAVDEGSVFVSDHLPACERGDMQP